MNNYEEMKIESDVFTTARENFDLLMQRLFASMEKNNSDEGSITLKVDLQMKQDWVPNGEGGSVEVNKPVIKHKVTIAVPVKDSMDSKKDTGMNLVWGRQQDPFRDRRCEGIPKHPKGNDRNGLCFPCGGSEAGSDL